MALDLSFAAPCPYFDVISKAKCDAVLLYEGNEVNARPKGPAREPCLNAIRQPGV